jgi:hypothetical protein
MKVLSSLCLMASFSLVTITPASAGSATYKGQVAEQPAQPSEQAYSYYCWARTQDGTEYRTAVASEPTPHDKDFTAKAKQAWVKHLSEDLGLTKFNARCGEGPTSTVSTWAVDSPNTKHVDWHYQ